MSFAASKYVKQLKESPDGRKLTIAEKLVLSLLADDHNEDEGCAWPSVGFLAERAGGMTEKHCRRLLHRLEGEGILESIPRFRENGGASSNGYRFRQIDPPFPARKVAHAKKMQQMQAANRMNRPVQMALNSADNNLDSHTPPPPLEGRGVLPPEGGGDSPAREGATPLEGSGGLPCKGGGKEPPLEPSGDLSLEVPLQPNEIPPTPQNRGVEDGPVEIDSRISSNWSLMKVRLKSELSLQLPNFTAVRPGESDYDSCFRDWVVVAVEKKWPNVTIATEAGDLAATQAGLKKYARRLEQDARKCFSIRRDFAVTFTVRPAG